MPPWTVICAILLANIALGWQIAPLFAPPELDWPEYIFISFALGTAVTGSVALILAEFGWFHIGVLGLLWLLSFLTLTLVKIKTQPAGVYPSFRWRRPQPWLLVVWLLPAAWLFFRPHEFIIGGADAGVYTNLSASIVRQGRIDFTDPLLAELDTDLAPYLLRPVPQQAGADYYLLPAFFVTDVASGRITPQFYHLHPVWQAIAYSLGGDSPPQAVRASLLLTGLWALAGALAVYLTTRLIAGWPAAALALFGLTLNAVQIWFARYPTTEMLSQFWLWTGLWAIGCWLSERPSSRLWAFLGGVAMGQFFLTRIDALFILPVLGALGAWVWLRRRRGRFWFLIPLAGFILHSLAHGWWISRPYFLGLSEYGLAILRKQQQALILVAVFLILAPIVYILLRHGPWQKYLPFAKIGRPLRGLLAVSLLLLAGYAWFIRPTLPPPGTWVDAFSANPIPDTNAETFLRLGWYLSPLGVALGAVGVAWLVWRMEAKTIVLLAITLLYTLFYLWNIRANPHQIYASRRYIMATIPLFVVGTAVLLTQILPPLRPSSTSRLAITWRHVVALLFILGWLGSSAWFARGFTSQVDYQGVIKQLDALNDQLDPQSVLIFNDPRPVGLGDFWGTPLKFLYEHEVFTLRQPDQVDASLLVQTIKNWQNKGYTVYWIGDTNWLAQQNIAHSSSISATLTAANLEATYDRKPQKIINVEWPLPIFEIAQ